MHHNENIVAKVDNLKHSRSGLKETPSTVSYHSPRLYEQVGGIDELVVADF